MNALRTVKYLFCGHSKSSCAWYIPALLNFITIQSIPKTSCSCFSLSTFSIVRQNFLSFVYFKRTTSFHEHQSNTSLSRNTFFQIITVCWSQFPFPTDPTQQWNNIGTKRSFFRTVIASGFIDLSTFLIPLRIVLITFSIFHSHRTQQPPAFSIGSTSIAHRGRHLNGICSRRKRLVLLFTSVISSWWCNQKMSDIQTPCMTQLLWLQGRTRIEIPYVLDSLN